MTGEDLIGVAITIAAAAAIWPHVQERRQRRQWENEMPNQLSRTLVQSLSDRELLRYADKSDLMQREMATRLEIALDIIDDFQARTRQPETNDQRECCF